ncbi:hypothetical protein M407DRAFT_33856 [Tulasnella calospora MUT 4182]|uniref:Protein kinase domain-containing protein n=1 Tax=Tulasnella calospora MUT 4182 TaxID=1051891 RepID=A0A0C3Q2A5_9AGAM|nr:hypothetical protein M407DRAFT_33856 [Tulasnella calospora MUT 4182]
MAMPILSMNQPGNEGPEWQQSARKVLDDLSHLKIHPGRLTMVKLSVYVGRRTSVAHASLMSALGEEVITSGRTIDVAVKEVSLHSSSQSKSFAHEAKILSEISHPNVVKLIGFLEDEESKSASLIFAWEANGNVREFVASGKWEIPERVSLIKDVMCGLHYLHSQEPPILHSDLKSAINSESHAVLTDFGSARRIRRYPARDPSSPKVEETPQREPSTGANLEQPRVEYSADTETLTLSAPGYTLRWAAPEVLADRPGLPGDIWSFAWVCWEIMTNKLPYSEIDRREALIAYIVLSKPLPSVREQEQTSPILQLCSLIVDCWNFDPTKRPDAARCNALLEWMPSAVPSADRAEVRSPLLLLKIGDMHRLQSRLGEALKSFQRALDISRHTEDHKTTAGATLLLGDVYKDLARLPEAELHFKNALELYEREADRTGMGTALVGLGNVYDAASQTSKAEVHYNQALDAFSQANNDLGRANAMVGLGRIYKGQSKLVQAAESYDKAREIYVRIGDEMGRANTLLGLGRVHLAQSQAKDAEEKCKEAQEIYIRIGGELGRANALETLGDVYWARSMDPDAASCYVEAAEIYGRLRYPQGQANAMLGLGRIHHAHSEYNQAELVYREALDIYTRVGDVLGKANTLAWLADTYRAESRYLNAEETYAQANNMYTRASDDLGRSSALLGLGQVRQALSKIAEAEAAFTEAANLAERVGNQGVQSQALMYLGLICGDRGDYRAAEKRFAEAVVILSGFGNETLLRVAQRALEGYQKHAKETYPIFILYPLRIIFSFVEWIRRVFHLLWLR